MLTYFTKLTELCYIVYSCREKNRDTLRYKEHEAVYEEHFWER